MKDSTSNLSLVTSLLAARRAELVGELRRYLAQPLPSGTSSLAFEISPEDASVMVYPMDREESQLGFAYILGDGPWGETDVGIFEPTDNLRDPAVVKAALEHQSNADAAVLTWFVDAWKEAAPNGVEVLATVQFHDGEELVEL
jgi:hypothetical protein